jgi:hypothetical protein
LNVVVAEVPTCTKLLQLAPAQRSIRYCVIVPPVSVAAVHARFTWVLPDAVAVSPVGAVNVGAAVVAVAVFEYALTLFAASVARTR